MVRALLLVAVVAYCAHFGVASMCDGNPCMNGGTCMDLGVAWICICPAEYTGGTCANEFTPTTPCTSNPCLNDGSCSVINDVDYQCQCFGNFQGINCETYMSNALAAVEPEVSSPCDVSPCSNGGQCLVSTRDPTQYICRCVEDFGGSNCEKMPCEMDPCLNGGACFSSYRVDGTYMCRCPRGYSGKNCEISDACSGNPCGAGNMCLDEKDGSFSCLCPCSAGSTCNSSPDSNDGSDGGDNTGTDGGDDTGTDGGDNTVTDGDSGTVDSGNNNLVENPVDNVNIFRCVRMMKATANCTQHGYCSVRDSTAICRCYDGYMGVACQDTTPVNDGGAGTRPITDSGSNTDGSGSNTDGSGSNTDGSGSNTDGSGSTGGSVSTGSPDSMTSRCIRMMRSTGDCMGHGYCEIDQETAICKCDPGYMGVACQDVSGETVDSTGGSTSGSTTTDNDNNGNTMSYPCTRMMQASSQCMGHGVCIMSSDTAVCYCNEGYKGVICEVAIDDGSVASNPATVDGDASSTGTGVSNSGTTNGGTSNSVSGSVDSLMNSNCARMMLATDNCNGRGRCSISHGDTAICICDDGYMGVVCQDTVVG
ncbi:uncharacterized protein [Asterias amurensis]|uniref:uncharacterized protein isoform X2 n=1 Tax=Asterias amurensis TaxID=7602 RepID=UPI003AB3C6A3